MPLWKKPSLYSDIDTNVVAWLLDKGSLTQKLVHKSNLQFRVEVLEQKVQTVALHESKALGINIGRWALVREVILYGKQEPWVYARTIIPLQTLQGPLRHLRYLGNQPLGDKLFNNPTMKRSDVEIACLPNTFLPQQIMPVNQPLWGRRSVFTLSNKPLLVSEFFLPDLLNSQ